MKEQNKFSIVQLRCASWIELLSAIYPMVDDWKSRFGARWKLSQSDKLGSGNVTIKVTAEAEAFGDRKFVTRIWFGEVVKE